MNYQLRLGLCLVLLLWGSNSIAQNKLASSRDSLRLSKSPESLTDANLHLFLDARSKQPDSAYYFGNQAELLVDSFGLKSRVSEVKSELAYFYKNSGEMSLARDKITEALAALNHVTDDAVRAHCLLIAGHVYSSAGELNRATSYYRNAQDLFEALGDQQGVSYCQSGLAIVMQDQGDTDRALALNKQALAYLATQKDDYYHRADVLNNVATIYAGLKMADSAMTYYNEALAIYVKLDYYSDQSLVYYNIGELYMELDQYTASVNNYRKCLEIAQKINSRVDEMWAYEGFARMYEHFGNFEQSLKYTKLYHALSDSLTNEAHSQEVAMAEAELRTQEKIDALERTNEQLDATQDELGVASNINITLWSALVLLLVIVVFGIYIFRLNRYTNRMLRKQQQKVISTNTELRKTLDEREVLLKEIHHRVKNNLQIISSLLNLQSRNLRDAEALDVLAEGRERIRAIALIHQKLYQNKNLAEVDFEEYIRDLIGHQQLAFENIAESIGYEIETKNVSLNLDTAVPIGLILSELISNANKHAFSSDKDRTIKVKLQALEGEEHSYLLEVSDNGRGLPEGFSLENSESLGLEIVQSLAEQLDGKLEVFNRNGACFQVRFNEIQS